MTKKIDASEAMSTAANEAIEKSQEMFSKTTTASEKFVEGMIEVNATAFKSAELVAKKAYENYVSNVAAAFDDAKSLAKTADPAEFYKSATSSFSKTSEKYTAQGKEMGEMASKVFKDNADLAKKFYSNVFSAV